MSLIFVMYFKPKETEDMKEMKKIIAALFILGALMTGNTIYANVTSTPPTEIPGKTTKVTFANVDDGAELYIKDSNERTIYSEKITREGLYAKAFDFSNLPPATYYFEVNSEDSIRIYPFTVSAEQVNMMDGERYSIAKPKIVMKGDRMYLTKDVAGQQSVMIDLFYEGHTLAYTEFLNIENELKRVYDFSTSKRGAYYVVIRTDDRTFREKVNISGTYW